MGDISLIAWLRSHEEDSGGPHPEQLTFLQRSIPKEWQQQWPLHFAAMTGDVESVERLIRQGASPYAKLTDWFDAEPLACAATFGQIRIVVALILAGANPLRSSSAHNFTPLHYARREHHLHVSTFLEEYKVPLSTPLHRLFFFDLIYYA